MTTSRTYRYEHQRREAEQREAAQRQADRDARHAACGTEHPHAWKNWTYSADYTHESRECRECGSTETRKVRF